MTLLETVTEILKRPVSEWTEADYKWLDEGNRKIGRDQMKDLLAKHSPNDGS